MKYSYKKDGQKKIIYMLRVWKKEIFIIGCTATGSSQAWLQAHSVLCPLVKTLRDTLKTPCLKTDCK